jgi:hypothetical protein
MSFASRSTVTGLVDESARRVARELRGEAGLLVLLSLPLRFLEAQILTRASSLEVTAGSGAAWAYLGTLSLLATGALVPALWARLVFVRAATAARAGRFRSGEVDLGRTLAVPPANLVGAAYLLAAAQALLFWGLPTLLGAPLAIALSALAAAASPYFERVGPWAPWRELGRSAPPVRIAVGLCAVFACAWVIAAVNLIAAFTLGRWLVTGAVPGFDEAWWGAVLSPGNGAFLYLLLAGAVLIVEPFWLAAWSAAVGDRRARDTGDDLAAWFGELRAAGAGPGEGP